MSTSLSMTRGDTKLVQVTLSNLTASGLAGYSFWFTVKNDVSDLDAAAVIQKSGAEFAVVANGDATTPGVVTCKLDPADTAGLPDYLVSLPYDVQVKDSLGNITTVASGHLKVSPDTTRATV